VLSIGAVRFFFAGVFFFVLKTLIGSTGGSSGTSYSANDVNRAGVAKPLDKAGVDSELGRGRMGVAPSGISPSFSITKDSEENVCDVALSVGSLVSRKS